MVIKELVFLSDNQQVIDDVVKNATKDQREKLNSFVAKKNLAKELTQINMKAKDLLTAFGTDKNRKNQNKYIRDELDELESRSNQIESQINTIELEINALENKIISAEVIRNNFKVFKVVFDHMTSDEKFDLLQLLVKRVTYFEEDEKNSDGKKTAKIKMDLWELPTIDPSSFSSAKSFAERYAWLPIADSNHGQGD